jgi:hypothetical protein
VDRPRGLEPIGPLLSAREYKCVSAYAQDLFIGDPVVAIATGRDINIATPGSTNALIGAIVAIYDENKVPLAYWDSGHVGEGYIVVADHPDQLFVCQGDGDTSYLDENDCNGNVPLVSGGGSTVTYRSTWELDDSATGGAEAAEQIRLIRPQDRPDNTIAIANCDWICKINNHQGLQGIVGAGI